MLRDLARPFRGRTAPVPSEVRSVVSVAASRAQGNSCCRYHTLVTEHKLPEETGHPDGAKPRALELDTGHAASGNTAENERHGRQSPRAPQPRQPALETIAQTVPWLRDAPDCQSPSSSPSP